MLTSVKLVNGERQMILLPRQAEGVFLQSLDAPSPSVREAVDDRTDDDGVWDATSLFGARSCAIELLVTQGARAVEDELSRYLHPMLRPYLVVEDSGWSQARRLMLRTDQFSAPLTTDLPRDARKIQAQWKCPDAVWEAADLATETVPADVQGDPVGRSYPLTYPKTYTATMVTGASIVTNLGGVPSHFVARLYGPCSGPSLKNLTTGEEITFLPSLSLAAGQYVEVDTRARSAVAQSDASSSRLNYVDFTSTSWWRIQPGDNQLRYVPRSGSSGAAAEIDYRPAWL
jgi:hypothetical protein